MYLKYKDNKVIMNNLLVSIYSHPDYYPPTLNALNILKKKFKTINVLHRNFIDLKSSKAKINYIPSGKLVDVRKMMKLNILVKFFYFLVFTLDFFRLITKNKPSWILIYDGIPLLSIWLILPFIRKNPKIWYHNHDVYEPRYLRKFSLSWFALKIQKRIFKRIKLFTLPSIERKKYFNLNNFNGLYFTIPNYPSSNNIMKSDLKLSIKEDIKILFQGSIGTGHGFEEIIKILNNKINGKSLKLILKGFVSKEYKNHLLNIAKKHSTQNKVVFSGITNYSKVKDITLKSDIGIAIFTKNDIMNSTLGTASNKIYEYVACGLPILYFDNLHFNKYLKKYKWAFATDLSKNSLLKNISLIEKSYESLSIDAYNDYQKNLNFEKVFNPILKFL